jgi:hypothetical protein
MEDKVYTNEEIEREVQERVNFKLNDIKDSINNHLKRSKWSQYHGIVELNKMKLSAIIPQHLVYSNYRITEESWTVLNEIFKKEIEMPVPYDEMYEKRCGKEKDEFIDKVMNDFEYMTRGMRIDEGRKRGFIKMLVSKIERIQRAR